MPTKYEIAWRRLRKGSNEPELMFAKKAIENGWIPTKRGWPDFLCFGPKGEIICVEVKPRQKNGKLEMLRVDQANTMDFFSSKGIRCFVSDGLTLEVYDRSKHAPKKRRRGANRWLNKFSQKEPTR